MNKIWAIVLCLILALAAVSCDRENNITNPEEAQTAGAEDQTLADYQKAYLAFLEDKKESHLLFGLAYVDDDNIPELYLSGMTEAGGDMVCAFKNGVVVCQRLNRIGGGKYIERNGDIINQNGHMGFYYENVYHLSENGFSQTLNASYTEEFKNPGNGEYEPEREYFIDDAPVSEADYNKAVSAAFDLSNAVSFYENAVSYDAIVRQLQEGSAAKY